MSLLHSASGPRRPVNREALAVSIRRVRGLTFPFAIDPVIATRHTGDALTLSGWAIHTDFEIQKVSLGQGEKALQTVRPEKHRPRAYEQFQQLPGSQNCGFDFELDHPGEGAYWIAIVEANGNLLRIANLELSRTRRRRMLYIHIAKAGGSTVNRMLSRHFAPELSQVHIESTEEWRKDPRALESREFLSGHLGLDVLDRRLNLKPFDLVTVVREPIEQLISHIAWIRRLAEPGEQERLEAHPPYIQSFAQKLSSYDLTEPETITRMIDELAESEFRLLDNYQVRHFTNPHNRPVNPADLELAKQALSRFRHIGIASNLDGFLAEVARDMQWPPMSPAGRENVTGNFFGLDRNNEALAEALQPLMRFDQSLYDFIVKNMSSSLLNAP